MHGHVTYHQIPLYVELSMKPLHHASRDGRVLPLELGLRVVGLASSM
jgi:hypothetical protein